MLARVVKFKCITGMEKHLSQLGREKLVPINSEAGCLEVYFMEPSIEDENSKFGVISIWKDKKDLCALKNDKKYHILQNDLAPFIESVLEEIYVIARS